ncbi:hypothetical protein BpHYR1_003981 [Brachionus plicatilis]|uniref:Uncharacterized protein n=1 Tax=Brachionus plicatilis TaxID=10195 RepID=A0A3M7RY68_BRAPC|nr:hypothetical protein BpHYR1_003981 [Brachionus plicatilis]
MNEPLKEDNFQRLQVFDLDLLQLITYLPMNNFFSMHEFQSIHYFSIRWPFFCMCCSKSPFEQYDNPKS